MIYKKIFILSCLLLLSSCSSTDVQIDKQSEINEQNKSETVTKENLVDHLYENQLNSQNKSESNNEDKIQLNEISIKGSAQLKRELNQVLSYHCMKHRKKFLSENQCLEKVNQIVKRCESDHKSINPDFVKCIKESLRKI